MVVAFGDSAADRPHVAGPPGGIQRPGPALVPVQRGALLPGRLRAAPDGGVGAKAGNRGAESDQVVLGGGLGLRKLPLQAPANRAPDQEDPKNHHDNHAGPDQDRGQR